MLRSGLRRLRRRTRGWRHSLKLRRDPLLIQHSVRLAPEDRATARKRWHVLVDLIHAHCPARGAIVVEVGAYQGHCSAHIHKYCPGVERIYAIDLRRAEPALDRTRGLARVTFVQEDSVAAARRFDDASVDLVFVDADHAEASVRSDLEAWLPKVRPGGVIAVHDYGSRRHPGVTKAVHALFAGHPRPANVEANMVWWTLK